MPPEVDALLDYKGGLEYYQRDDAMRKQTMLQFERNLERMVRHCRDAEVPLLMMNPVSNLKDSPPFKFSNDESLSPAARSTFDLAWDQARAPGLTAPQRREALHRVVGVDDRHAGAHYLLGMSWWDQGRYSEALAAFIRAKEEDLCPLRMLEPMHESVLSVARKNHVPLIDVRSLIADRSIGGIPGNEWLVDHVHPTFRGHQVIAHAGLLAMVDAGYVELSPGWEERRDRLMQQQFDSLDPAYHARGQRQRNHFSLWAQGRSMLIREPAGTDSLP